MVSRRLRSRYLFARRPSTSMGGTVGGIAAGTYGRSLGFILLAIVSSSLMTLLLPAPAAEAQTRSDLEPPNQAISPRNSFAFPELLRPAPARPGWSHRVDCRNYGGDSVDGVSDGSNVSFLNCGLPTQSLGQGGPNPQPGEAVRQNPAFSRQSLDQVRPPLNPLLLRCEAPELPRLRFHEQPDDSAQARDFCGVRVYF